MQKLPFLHILLIGLVYFSWIVFNQKKKTIQFHSNLYSEGYYRWVWVFIYH